METKFNKSKKEYSKKEMKDLIDEGRVLNFKTMVNHLFGGKDKKNKDHNVDKYCDYGCYCVPLGNKDNWVGAGEPVRVLHFCCQRNITHHKSCFNSEES